MLLSPFIFLFFYHRRSDRELELNYNIFVGKVELYACTYNGNAFSSDYLAIFVFVILGMFGGFPILAFKFKFY